MHSHCSHVFIWIKTLTWSFNRCPGLIATAKTGRVIKNKENQAPMTVVEYSVSTGQFSGLMAHYSLVDLPFDLRASFRPDVCRSVTGHNWERFIVQYLCVFFGLYDRLSFTSATLYVLCKPTHVRNLEKLHYKYERNKVKCHVINLVWTFWTILSYHPLRFQADVIGHCSMASLLKLIPFQPFCCKAATWFALLQPDHAAHTRDE